MLNKGGLWLWLAVNDYVVNHFKKFWFHKAAAVCSFKMALRFFASVLRLVRTFYPI